MANTTNSIIRDDIMDLVAVLAYAGLGDLFKDVGGELPIASVVIKIIEAATTVPTHFGDIFTSGTVVHSRIVIKGMECKYARLFPTKLNF